MVKQLLLDQPTPFKFILGVRDPSKSKPQFDSLRYDTSKHDISLHKVDFANLREVRTFAREAIATLGKDKLDYVLLNHGMAKGANGPGEHGSPWSESFVVNHQCKSIHLRMTLLNFCFSSSLPDAPLARADPRLTLPRRLYLLRRYTYGGRDRQVHLWPSILYTHNSYRLITPDSPGQLRKGPRGDIPHVQVCATFGRSPLATSAR